MHAAWWVWQVLTPSTGAGTSLCILSFIEGEKGLAQGVQKLRLPLNL